MKLITEEVIKNQKLSEVLSSQQYRDLKGLEKKTQLTDKEKEYIAALKKRDLSDKFKRDQITSKQYIDQAKAITKKYSPAGAPTPAGSSAAAATTPAGSAPVIKQVRGPDIEPPAPTEPRPVQVDWGAESEDEPKIPPAPTIKQVLAPGPELEKLYMKAVGLAIEKQAASESMLQRELGISYTLANKIVDRMRADGFAAGSKIIISSENFEKLKSMFDPDNPLIRRGTKAQRSLAAREREKEIESNLPIPTSKLPPIVQQELIKSLGVHFKKLKQAGIDPDKLYAAFNDFMKIITDGKLTDDEADKLLSAAGVEIDQGPSTAPLIPDEEKEGGGFTPFGQTLPKMTAADRKRVKHINLNVPEPPGGGLEENARIREEIGAALAGILSAVRSGNRDEDEEEEG